MTLGRTFDGKVVIVTGGGGGIGRETALAFAREGAGVVVAGRGEAAGQETARLIRHEGGEGVFVRVDVSVEAEVALMVEETVARYGRVDVACNNAGVIMGVGPLADLEETAWDSTVDVNLKGTWLCMKQEIRQMLRQGGGAIVNVASNVGPHVVVPGLGAYAASKAGMLALTRAAAIEYVRSGIRINAVSPGPIDTAMSRRPAETDEDRDRRVGAAAPIGRVGRRSEVAEAILWLASDKASLLVGEDVLLDGGFSIQ